MLSTIISLINDAPGLRSNAIAEKLNLNQQTARKGYSKIAGFEFIKFVGVAKKGRIFQRITY